MRDPLSSTIKTIQPSGIRKFFDIVSEMKDAISLGVGEPDFDTPWHIRDEGIYSLEKGRTFYTSNAGLKELKIEIAKYLDRRYGMTYDYNKEIMVTVGGSEAIDIALRAMLDAGDEVIIPQPSYVSYVPCTVLAGGTPVIVELKEENDFRLTAEELEAVITPKTKILIMPFPNNPTGAIMEKADLEAIVQVVKEHDLFVISDEIYSELTYVDKHVSIASFPGMKERTITIGGMSKSYAMTGWRIGYAMGSPAILKAMQVTGVPQTISVNTMVQKASEFALNNCDDAVGEITSLFKKRVKFAYEKFKDLPGIKTAEPKGSFYLFLDVSGAGMDGEEFADRALREAKVVTIPGASFGPGCGNYVRIACTVSEEMLEEASQRILKILLK